MASKIEGLLESFQGNAYPAMLEDLANHLGVTEDSLRRLALGWAPVVEFKKGKSFTGWWVIPERDASGNAVGLSLRNQSDFKVMLSGSKHGIIYEVNPEHDASGGGYSAGAHNWVRTMDAGVPCPVCGKPDGCVLSAENPADPKAVICIREKRGAEKPMKFGYLHLRKSEARLSKNVSALAGDPNEYVLVVEGMTDTAVALDLGFGGAGRPSNLACMDVLRDLVRGRKVIVLGENDKKADGKEPGREGMVAAFQVLQKVCSDIRMVMPPSHVKDLRAWKTKFGLTREAFLQYVVEQGQEKAAAIVLPDQRPLTVARQFLDDTHRMAGRYTAKKWAGSWFTYAGHKYSEVKDDAFLSPIFPWSHDKMVEVTNTKTGATSLIPLLANTALIQNVAAAITSEVLVQHTRLPCWVNGANGPDPRNLISFTNGILDVDAFIDGRPEKEYLLESTPDLFTTTALPFPFDATAECPTWKKFLGSSLGDESSKISLLREWFGYCLTPDTSLQKMMYLRGPSGAGKSVILNVLCSLLGDEQVTSTSFADLAGSFGVQSMIGKLVCVIPDARTPRWGDNMRGLELLLNITSGDGIQINRKFKDPIERHRLTARITIASNEFLDVPDHSGAMLRRLNIIEFKKSFVGREDFGLPDKLAAEIPGIALWALAGLKRLRDNGKFTMPASMEESLGEWRRSTSPLASFVEECCDLDPQRRNEVVKHELFNAWQAWSAERRMNPLSMSKFLERLRSAAPLATSDTYEKGGHKFSVFRGIDLKPWAAKQYTGRPK